MVCVLTDLAGLRVCVSRPLYTIGTTIMGMFQMRLEMQGKVTCSASHSKGQSQKLGQTASFQSRLAPSLRGPLGLGGAEQFSSGTAGR